MRRPHVNPQTQSWGRLKAVALGALLGCILGLTFIGSVDKILRSRKEDSNVGNVEVIRDLSAEGLELLSVSSSNHDRSAATERLQIDQQTTIHTLCTSNGSPYLNFQTRIMYGTYKLVQQMPGGENLVGFTRILHRTKPDILMDEVPTFRADPLTPQCDGWCEFPVSDRPNAVAQFLKAADADASMIKAPWILMLEGDYVWMKPLPAPRADSDSPSWAFPFSYIQPQAPHLHQVMRLMYSENKGPLSDIPNSGPAPVLMRVDEWRKVVPDWERLAAHIEAHKDTKEALGWVREMYGWSIAAALQGIKLELKLPPDSPLIAQPPHEKTSGNASMLHYTWGTLVNDASGNRVWSFEKRDYVAPELEKQVPLLPLPPLFREGLKLHEGAPYDLELHSTMQAMLKQMNRAILEMPSL